MTQALWGRLVVALAGVTMLVTGLPGQTPVAGGSEAGTLSEIRYGPFGLAPAGAGGDLDHANVAMPNVPKPCDDCFILSAEPDLVYPDGTSANLDTGVMLHHAVFFNSGEQDTTCGRDWFFRNLGERFLASGNERTKRDFPPGYGYHLGTAPVNAIFHVMNHSPSPKTVYFRYKIRWVPASEAAGLRPVVPLWLDVNNCRDSEYDVPAGPSSERWQWRSTVTGRIVWTAGHVHTGGVRTTLRNTTTDRHICTAWASYGTKPAYMGAIESMSTCVWDGLGTVREGDTLDLEGYYHSAEAVPGAMTIMVAYLWKTPEPEGGTPAPPEASGDKPQPATAKPPASSHHHPHQGGLPGGQAEK
jgi:stress up-regulated protein Nod 19